MADFTNSNGLGDWYGELLNSARQQLVQLPDGSFVQAPQYGQATTVDDLYRGIIPSVPGPLKNNKVATVPIGQNGNVAGSSFTGGWGSGGFALPGMNADTTQFAERNANDTVQNIPAPQVYQRPPSIDATNPIDMFQQFGIMPSPPPNSNPALAAIDSLDLGGSGRSTAFPFPMPMFRAPSVPAVPGGRDQAWVDQGPDMGALNNAGGVNVPMPRSRPNPPSMPSGLGPITFKEGDRVWNLARERGMTVPAFAALYGISNPDKIRAGDTVIPRVPQPRMPLPSVRAPQASSSFTNPSASHWDPSTGSWT